MSPRRKIDADQPEIYSAPAPKSSRRWALPILTVLSAALVAAAIAASTFMLVSHETDRRTPVRDADVLNYVRSFMTTYTTLDPFHANYYGDRIQSQATGDFAKMFKEKINEILVQVARAEPTQGTVVEAGSNAGPTTAAPTSLSPPRSRTTRRTERRSKAETVGS